MLEVYTGIALGKILTYRLYYAGIIQILTSNIYGSRQFFHSNSLTFLTVDSVGSLYTSSILAASCLFSLVSSSSFPFYLRI